MIPAPLNAWPTERPEPDCWGGDEWLFDPSSHANHCTYTATPIEDPREYERIDREFMEAWFACARGEISRDDTSLVTMSNLLGLPPTPHHENRAHKTSPAPVDPLRVWEVLENAVPDIVTVAIDRVLGPYADETLDRSLHRVAVEAIAFSPTVDLGLPAIQRWSKDPIRPSPAIRAGLRSIEHSPAMLWSLTEEGMASPMLPLAHDYWPKTALLGTAAELPRCHGDALLGRAYPTEPGQWCLSGGLWVSAPPLDGLLERLELEHLRLSRHERRLTWEDLLRWRGELLYRICCTHSAFLED